MGKNLKNIYIFSILVLLLDQILKIFISSKMVLNQSFVLIKNFLSITLVKNTGAAFSILEGNRLLLIIIGILAIVGISFYIKSLDTLTDLDLIIYPFLIGGVLGNLVDRIIHGYVIDYISFSFGSYHFPVFNFADICIVVSIVIMLIRVVIGDLWKW